MHRFFFRSRFSAERPSIGSVYGPVRVVAPGEHPGALRTVLPTGPARAVRVGYLVAAVEAHLLRPEPPAEGGPAAGDGR